MKLVEKALLYRQRAIATPVTITYLLRDDFTTDAGAPLASPRTADPGPGTETLVQTDGQFSTSSGALNFVAQTTPNYGDQYVRKTTGLARVIGRAFFAGFTFSTQNIIFFGWANTASVSFGVSFDHAYVTNLASSLAGIGSGGGSPIFLLPFKWVNGTAYKIAVVLRSGSALYYVKGGVYVVWTLVWVDKAGATATVYPAMSNLTSAGTLDSFIARDLPAPWTTDYGTATQQVTSPVSGTTYAGVADGIFDLTVTAPTPLADSAELRFRVQDATNYWTAYFDSAGAFKVDSVASGSPTNRISAAAQIAAGQTRTIRAETTGALLDAYIFNGAVPAKQGAQVNVNYLTTKTSVVPVLTGAWTMANLEVWNGAAAIYDTELDKT